MNTAERECAIAETVPFAADTILNNDRENVCEQINYHGLPHVFVCVR